MATLCEWNKKLKKPSGEAEKKPRKRESKRRSSRNLLDRFWASVRLEPSEDGSEDVAFRSNDYGSPIAEHRGLEIFAKSGSLPTINLAHSRTKHVEPPLQITITETAGPYQALDLFEPHSSPKTTSPIPGVLAASPGPLSSRNCPSPPKLSIPEQKHPEALTTHSPATAILDMASKFLHNIVQLTTSRTSTPCNALAITGDADAQVVESEVFVNVIEDGKRSGVWDHAELQDDRLEKLAIPHFSTIGLVSTHGDKQSSWMVDGPAVCAQEVDAMSRMCWERQLLNQHLSSWH